MHSPVARWTTYLEDGDGALGWRMVTHSRSLRRAPGADVSGVAERGDTAEVNDLKQKRVAILVTETLASRKRNWSSPRRRCAMPARPWTSFRQKREPVQAFKHHDPTIKVDVDKYVRNRGAPGSNTTRSCFRAAR